MPTMKIKKCLTCDIAHSWFFEGMTLKELRSIKRVSGMSQKEFAAAGDDGDPEALAVLLWVLHTRNKIKIDFDDVDLDFNDFEMVLTDQEQKDYDAAEKAREAAEKTRGPKGKNRSNGKTLRAD